MIAIPTSPLELRMVGLSHLYGKIVLNVKLSYVPPELLLDQNEMKNMFRVLTNSQQELTVNAMYINRSTYTFVILYDFGVEPIDEYLTRVEISKKIQDQYFKSISVKPLFIRINPALMAKN